MALDMEKIEFAGSFLDIVNASVFFIDTEERIIYVNKSAEKLEGHAKETLLGRTVFEIYGINDTPLLRALRTQTPIRNFSWRYFINGVTIIQQCNAFPLYDNGKLVGAYTVQQDLTKINEIISNNIDLQKSLFPDSLVLIPDQTEPSGQREGRESDQNFQNIVGAHPLFVDALEKAILAARSDSPVMLTAATGCGKEMFAKSIHNAGKRKNKPFIAINCASIPESLLESILFGTAKGAYTDAKDKPGVFEQAENGTLFLDEINSMPLYSQSKLLRALEEKRVRRLGGNEEIPVNVRIISSSNGLSNRHDGESPLREDLFYRLSVVNIVIPPLMDRRSDIPILTDHFIRQLNKEFHKNINGLDWEITNFFMKYSWPGNVRQLKNSIESAMNFVDDNDTLIHKEHLPQYLFALDPEEGMYPPLTKSDHPADLPQENPIGEKAKDLPSENIFDRIKQEEKERIIRVLRENNGNISQTARDLNMHRQSLIHRLKKYGLK